MKRNGFVLALLASVLLDPFVSARAQIRAQVGESEDATIWVEPGSIRAETDNPNLVWANVRIWREKRLLGRKGRTSSGEVWDTADMRWLVDCAAGRAFEVDTTLRGRGQTILEQSRRGIAGKIPISLSRGSLNALAFAYVCKGARSMAATRARFEEAAREEKKRSAPALAPAPARVPAPAPVPAPVQISGTALAVSAAGHLLTNNHVVRNCTVVNLVSSDGAEFVGRVIARDQRNDLALIKADRAFAHVGTFRSSPIRAGESVTAIGYPLKGLLALEANVSVGIVSATAGILNDISQVQISAPVQPGNSGGPLLDTRGSVTGVVVSKLDALEVAKITGDLPQNINFAIKGEMAQLFLRASGVEPTYSPRNAPSMRVEDAVAAARLFTFATECESRAD